MIFCFVEILTGLKVLNENIENIKLSKTFYDI